MTRVYGGWLLAGWLAAIPAAGAVGDAPPAAPADQGAYLLRIAGCANCHTNDKHGGAPLAGGRALITPFGTFYSPNITPDPDTGIGGWTEPEFARALRDGVGRDGAHLYPSFPYPSYTRLSDTDIHTLWLYLRVQPPVRMANKAHDLRWFVSARPLLRLWKMLYFTPGAYAPDTTRSAAWNRGAYLAEAVAHCGECHSPRNALGGVQVQKRYAGTRSGPEDSVVPNITPDRKTGIGKWSRADLTTYLDSGLTPDGDSAGGLMAEEIDNSLHYLSKDDRAALVEYLTTLPAVDNDIRSPTKKVRKKEAWE
jgi:mono/diheme cytochrome c family protein